MNKFYSPTRYEDFDEGVTSAIFPKSKILRLIFGWLFVSWIFYFLGIKKTTFSSRLIEIPLFWVYFGKYFSKKKARVFDFGCVESKISLHLAALGHEVIAVDLRDYEYYNTFSNLTFIKGDFFEINKQLEKVDFIIAISSIEHVGLDTYGNKNVNIDADLMLMDVFYNFLSDDGFIYLSIPFGQAYEIKKGYRIYDRERLEKLFGKKFRIVEEFIFKPSRNQCQCWQRYSEDSWCGLIQKNKHGK